MYYDGFHRSFSDLDDLDTVQESDCIFAFETPEIFRSEGILSQRGQLGLGTHFCALYNVGLSHERPLAYGLFFCRGVRGWEGRGGLI